MERMQPSPDTPKAPPAAGEGRLIFAVSTAGGAIPLEGAAVTVRRRRSVTDGSGGEVMAVVYSDASGKTEMIPLPAPAKSLSLTPPRAGEPAPYALYDAEVILPAYYTQTFTRIPVFDGITSIQQAALIPLPENGFEDGLRPDGERVTEGMAPGL